MLLAALVNSLWSQLASALFSINRTTKISLAYSVTMLLGCLATFFTAKQYGIQGATTIMCLVEVAMVVVIVPIGCQVIQENPLHFLRSATRLPDQVKEKLAKALAGPRRPGQP